MKKIKFPLLTITLLLLMSGCKPDQKQLIMPFIVNNGSGSSGSLRSAGERSTFTADGVSFNMRYVPAKRFKSGVNDDGRAWVKFSYRISETEVTYELWNTVRTWAESNGYTFANAGHQGADTNGCAGDPVGTNQHPVTCINWRDAMVWMNALTEWYNAKTGSTYQPAYYDGDGDTESSADIAVFTGTSTETSGNRSPNRLGLYDMSGNVWEWNFDWYPSEIGSGRICSGGDWENASYDLQIGIRSVGWNPGNFPYREICTNPDGDINDVGIRIVKSF